MEDTKVYFGGEVKALEGGRVGGYLVRYGGPKDADLELDFFTKDTEFGVVEGGSLPVFYNHGLDDRLRSRRIGSGPVKFDEAGLWVEAQLEMRDEYEQAIYQMAKDGKLGWSSGAAGHLVEREKKGKSHFVKTWVIGEASLTPTPAEPRNTVMPIKSLITPNDAVHEGDEEPIKEIDMDEEKLMELLNKQSEKTVDAVNEAVKAVEEKFTEHSTSVDAKINEFKATLPDIKAGVEVVKDEADKTQEANPLRGGEFLREVKAAASGIHSPRLQAYLEELKATGMNEAIPSQAGFLVPPADQKDMLERMYNIGEVLGRVQTDNVAGNSMNIPAVDETSRVDGSRYGGVQGYWLEEGGDKTGTKPKFRQISLKLKKVAALVYATDEMLEDVAFMSSWLNRVVPDELRFKTEAAIVDGNGAGMPLGWLNSAALVSATRTNATNIDQDDISRMWARRWTGANDYVWFVHQDTMPELDALYTAAGTGGIAARFVDYDAQGVMRLKGKPVLEIEYAKTLGTAGDISLISPSQIQSIRKASGIQSASSIHVQFTTDETAFRFVYRVDAKPLWNSALTPYEGSNTVSPYVVLAATT